MNKLWFLSLVCLVGCAMQRPRTEVLLEVPTTLSPELQEKFKVEKIPEVVPAPVVKPPLKSKSKKTKIVPPAPAVRVRPTYPFVAGEVLNYSISAVGVKAGQLTLKVLSDNYQLQQQPVWYFRAEALSSPFFTNFYKINLAVEAFADLYDLRGYRYQIFGDEGKTYKRNLEFLDYPQQKILVFKRNPDSQQEELQEENPLVGPAHDFLSLFYRLRTLPLRPGTQELPIVNNGKYQLISVSLESATFQEQAAWKFRFNFQSDKVQDNYLIMLANDQRTVVEIYAKLKFGGFTLTLQP